MTKDEDGGEVGLRAGGPAQSLPHLATVRTTGTKMSVISPVTH